MYSITSDAKKKLNKINLSADDISENSSEKAKKQNKLRQAKTKNINELKEGWKDNPLHGKYPIFASVPSANSSLTHQWLAQSRVKFETEGFIIAVQTGTESINKKVSSKHIRQWC